MEKDEIMEDHLLRGLKGEKDMIEKLSCLTEQDVKTKQERWCMAGPKHSVNPFGKLVKENQEQKVLKKSGKIIITKHRKYHHGFFVRLTCSNEFYENNKKQLDKYILTSKNQKELNINPNNLPAWF